MNDDEAVDLSRLQVLLVDDEKFALRLETMALKQAGITQITIAENGEEALRLLSDHHFDLVLSDWNMPGATGLELLKHIKQSDNKALPFIMLTGNKAMQAVQEAVASGVDGYLVKPFSVAQLRSKLVAALRRHERM